MKSTLSSARWQVVKNVWGVIRGRHLLPVFNCLQRPLLLPIRIDQNSTLSAASCCSFHKGFSDYVGGSDGGVPLYFVNFFFVIVRSPNWSPRNFIPIGGILCIALTRVFKQYGFPLVGGVLRLFSRVTIVLKSSNYRLQCVIRECQFDYLVGDSRLTNFREGSVINRRRFHVPILEIDRLVPTKFARKERALCRLRDALQ